MKKLLKSKVFIAYASVALIFVIVVSVVLINFNKPVPVVTGSTETSKPTNDIIIKSPILPPNTHSEAQNPIENQNEKAPILDVSGNPVSKLPNKTGSVKPTENPNKTTSSNPSTPKPPSADALVTPDGTQPKGDEPNPTNPADQNDPNGWTPPPPGVGTGELISQGAESIKIDINTSIETLQRAVGLQVGSNLLNAGYNTLYPNAGAPQDMVEAAVKNYANTGTVTLNPVSYGLPKIVGHYNIKLTAQGTNVSEAGKYIFEYMKNDKNFNDMVKSTFNVYKDGWLSVYQKDGYFYILFAVIDKGYSSFG
jgi:hypothetical protein